MMSLGSEESVLRTVMRCSVLNASFAKLIYRISETDLGNYAENFGGALPLFEEASSFLREVGEYDKSFGGRLEKVQRDSIGRSIGDLQYNMERAMKKIESYSPKK